MYLRRRLFQPIRAAVMAALVLGLFACGQQSIESEATEQLRSGASITGYPLKLHLDVSARTQAGAVRLLHALQSKGFPVTYEVTTHTDNLPTFWVVHVSSGLLRDEQELETTFHLLMSIGRTESNGIAWTVQRAQANGMSISAAQHN